MILLTDFAPTTASKSRYITHLDDCPNLRLPTDFADEATKPVVTRPGPKIPQKYHTHFNFFCIMMVALFPWQDTIRMNRISNYWTEK